MQMRISSERYAQLCEFMYEQTGVVLSPEKHQMVTSRIQQRARVNQSLCLNSYLDYAFNNKGEQSELVSALTTHKTHFFREPKGVKRIVEHALLASKQGSINRSAPYRVWSAACSTGEEPYSVAMWLAEALGTVSFFDVLGSDICTQVLRKASRGVYSVASMGDVNPSFQQQFMIRHPNGSLIKIRDKISARVTFKQVNLMTEFTSSHAQFDSILCRNVLIYFDPEGRKQVINRLVSQLKINGLLVVGASESTPALHNSLKQVEPSIFKRIR